MPQPTKPNLVWHADWGSNGAKRWCAKGALGADGNYTAFAPEPVGDLGSLIGRLCKEGENGGCVFAGFDFPIAVPAFYAKHVGITSFPTLLRKLGDGDWKDFYSVCDKADQISLHRPFYPNGA